MSSLYKKSFFKSAFKIITLSKTTPPEIFIPAIRKTALMIIT